MGESGRRGDLRNQVEIFNSVVREDSIKSDVCVKDWSTLGEGDYG